MMTRPRTAPSSTVSPSRTGGGCEQILVAADVVEVMMRREDGGEPGAPSVDLLEHGRRFGAVDDGCLARPGIDQDVGVVVGELRDGEDVHEMSVLHRHRGTL